ncbi:capsid protein [Pacific flying fox associated cyclovirus-1]|uniref:Capsid protein n=1 Tax=Pacific flying fox associated cyclovirus-1 TaxID=1795983 RepID=A0A140CTJ2_9CIRC|nr:capsid protein [Pacific flying fox associated cyclovirus-1]AMH87649.1 capsid protein [Pacific flying fox associated cyclovirus-1]
MRRMRLRRYRPRRVVAPRRGIRKRRSFRRRRNRKYDVHNFRLKSGSYVVDLTPGVNGGARVVGEAVVLNQLPINFNGLTLLYSHIRITKAVYRFIPMYTQRTWPDPATNDTDLPEILSTQWYGPALDVDSNPSQSYNVLRSDFLTRNHQWNRPFKRVLYPKVNYFVTASTYVDNAAPNSNTACALKKMPWVRTSGSNAYDNLQCGVMYVGAIGGPAGAAVKYRVERTYYVQARKV